MLLHKPNANIETEYARREARALRNVIATGKAEIENAFLATPSNKWKWLFPVRDQLSGELEALARHFLESTGGDADLDARMRLACMRMRAHAAGEMGKARRHMPPPRR
jgi:hypothetical protein